MTPHEPWFRRAQFPFSPLPSTRGASFITIFFNGALAACVQMTFAGKRRRSAMVCAAHRPCPHRVATMIAAFTAAGEIFTVALYRYATTGQPPSGYDAATMGSALRRR